jgi:hypothetical protein
MTLCQLVMGGVEEEEEGPAPPQSDQWPDSV